MWPKYSLMWAFLTLLFPILYSVTKPWSGVCCKRTSIHFKAVKDDQNTGLCETTVQPRDTRSTLYKHFKLIDNLYFSETARHGPVDFLLQSCSDWAFYTQRNYTLGQRRLSRYHRAAGTVTGQLGLPVVSPPSFRCQWRLLKTTWRKLKDDSVVISFSNAHLTNKHLHCNPNSNEAKQL